MWNVFVAFNFFYLFKDNILPANNLLGNLLLNNICLLFLLIILYESLSFIFKMIMQIISDYVKLNSLLLKIYSIII